MRSFVFAIVAILALAATVDACPTGQRAGLFGRRAACGSTQTVRTVVRVRQPAVRYAAPACQSAPPSVPLKK